MPRQFINKETGDDPAVCVAVAQAIYGMAGSAINDSPELESQE